MIYCKNIYTLLQHVYHGDNEYVLKVIPKTPGEKVWSKSTGVVSLNIGRPKPIQISNETYEKIKDKLVIVDE